MISVSKTNDFKSPYEAPKCKTYSISVESVMQTGSGELPPAPIEEDEY